MRGSHAELVRHGMRAGSDRRRVAEGLLGSSDEARRAELEEWCLGCGLFVCKGVSMMGCVIHTVHMEVAEKVCSYGVDESLLEETKNGVITCKLSEMKSYELPW